jgi:hypothetical protein
MRLWDVGGFAARQMLGGFATRQEVEKMKKWFLAFAVLLIALTGCQSQPSPEDILADLESALNAGDVDGAMAFFADDAVVKLVPALPPGSPDTYSGLEEIRGWFEELVAGNFEIDVDVLDVDGDTVATRTSTWMDATRELGVAPLVATEVYTFRQGKIRGFTWSISDESMARVQAAMAPAMTVIFEGDVCSYEGPTTIPAGRVNVNWAIKGRARDGYALAVVTLDEGKTFEDLNAWPSVGQPPWAELVALEERFPDSLSPFVADVTEGPVFLVCLTADPEAKVGVLGPVEVER